MLRLLAIIYTFMIICVNNAHGADNGQMNGQLSQAISLFEMGKNEEAKSELLAFEDNPTALVYLARLAIEDDLDDAEELIEASFKLDSSNGMTAFYRGMIMGRQASNAIFSALSYAKKSQDSFALAVELEPDNVEYRRGLMMFHLSAPSIAGGDESIAITQLEAIKQMSDYQGWHAQLMFHQQTDDNKGYLETINAAIQQYPNIPDFYALQGLTLQSDKQYEQAIALFVTAAQQESALEESDNYKHMAVYQIGRTSVLSESWLQQGHDALLDYLQNAPEDAGLPNKEWATYRLAQILHFQSKDSQAKSLLKMLGKTSDKELKKISRKLLKQIKV